MVYELLLEDEQDGVFAISLVEDPAIELDFVYLNKQKPIKFQAVNEEKRLVVGPILVPDKHILRVDEKTNLPYSVFFSKHTVQLISQKYMEQKNNDQVTIQHDFGVEDISLVESWLVESEVKDKSKLYKMSVPIGTWMGVMKVNNDEVWNDFIKTGELKGFSVEGIFEHKPVGNNMDISLEDTILAQLNKLVNMESYSDYGEGIRNNAKRGIELNEKQGNKCATQTGKIRGQQLANGEPISLETIRRMYSYLSRAESDYDPNDTTSCGTISYLLWGGKAGLSWSRNKLRELGLLEENQQPTIDSSYPGEVASGSISKETLQAEEMNVYGYDTSHFYLCPGAIGTFKHLTEEMDLDEDLIDMVRAAAVIADGVFMIEEEVVNNKFSDETDLRRADMLVSMFKDIFKTIDERTNMVHDISYMDGHIEVIKSYLNG